LNVCVRSEGSANLGCPPKEAGSWLPRM
jgi:hypothetical protein